MVDVTAIVVNWNTREILRDCLQSIYEQAGDIQFEIIVVDNASSDGSCEMVEKEFAAVKLIRNNANRGYAAAINQGIRAGQGRYFLFLNSDVIICDKAIEKTVRYADEHSDVAATSCQVFMRQGVPQPSFFRFPDVLNIFLETFGLSRIFRDNRFFGRELMIWLQRDKEREKERQVDVISGMFMLVRRKAVEDVGLMDESFFFLFEETDLCYRLSKAGWKTMYWPGAKIIHMHGGKQSRNKAGVKIAIQHPKSMLIFFRKHHSYTEYLLVRTLLAVRGLLRCPVWGIQNLYRKLTGQDAQYEDGKMWLYWWSFWFCVLGIEPGTGGLRHLIGSVSRGIKNGIETIFALGYRAASLLLRCPPAKVVLYYHAMKQKHVAGFENQMKYLAKFCHIVRASDIMTGEPKDGTKPIVAIIFDDAFASFMDNALPVLERYGLSSAVAVPVGVMGKSPDWPMGEDYDDNNEIVLDANSVVELDRRGCEIMSHTISHPNLTKISNDKLKTELCESKRILEEILGRDVDVITYPYGACDSLVCQAAADAGYRTGFSVEPRTVCQSANPLCIGRFKVSPYESMVRFRLKAQGAYRVAGFLRRFKRMLIGK